MLAFESESADCRIKDFLELVELEQEAGDEGALVPDANVGPDMVRIMTVHGSKGLEFDYVFLSHLVDRKFPTDERHDPIEIPDALVKEQIPEGNIHLEEERRLFYVAVTRAKKGLFFTTAEDYGGVRKKKLSRFLSELGFEKPELDFSTVKASLSPLKGDGNANANYELPKKFSFSQMQMYERCPLQYKFSNILKIPTFGNAHFTFGTVIHSTLQKFLEEFLTPTSPQQSLFGAAEPVQKKPDLNKLLKIYEDSWRDDWFADAGQKKEYYEKGKKLLKVFFEEFSADMPAVKFLETGFNFPLGKYLFNGRIDRIDEKNELCEIIDYKTGQAKGDDLSTDDKRQLLFYQIAAEEILKLPLEKLTYYYLESGKKVSFLGKDKDKDKLKEKFLDIIAQIEARNFEPSPNPNICMFCDFKDICEFK
jgi:DNA helicase-2/ATP-dependent DNA helicase PcrA